MTPPRADAPERPASGAAPDQRGRILAIALSLMSERGAHDCSMRTLADACGLNVATLYHYFPSKADLIRAVIEDRRYVDRLAEDVPPIDATQPPRDRLEAMLRWLWRATLAEEALVQLILGESLRGDPVALDTVRQLLDAMDAGFEHWLAELIPELEGDRAAKARVLRGQLIAWLIEAITVPARAKPAYLDRRASELATLLVPT